jgi:hypothetical protein
MPIDMSETSNSLSDYLLNVKIIGKTVNNPFYAALLITAIIVFTMIFVFRNVEIPSETNDSNETLYSLAIKAGFYILIFVTGILFLQNKSVINEFSGNKNEKIGSAEHKQNINQNNNQQQLQNINQNNNQQQLQNNNQIDPNLISSSNNVSFI